MTEPIQNPPRQPEPGGAARAPQLRGAARSSSPEPSVIGAWVVTLVLILVAGGTLYAVRSPVNAALDRWLPTLARPSEEPAQELPEPVPEPAPVAEEESGPVWTFVDIEAAIGPLPESTDALIAEGRSELSQFTGLSSKDETRALLIRNRWRLWGRIWHNRVEQIRGAMPPLEECVIHAALEPICLALTESLASLDQVPSANSVAAAKDHFAEAARVLEELRNPPLEEELDDGNSAEP